MLPDGRAEVRDEDGELVGRLDVRLEEAAVGALDSVALLGLPSLEKCLSFKLYGKVIRLAATCFHHSLQVTETYF